MPHTTECDACTQAGEAFAGKVAGVCGGSRCTRAARSALFFMLVKDVREWYQLDVRTHPAARPVR